MKRRLARTIKVYEYSMYSIVGYNLVQVWSQFKPDNIDTFSTKKAAVKALKDKARGWLNFHETELNKLKEILK